MYASGAHEIEAEQEEISFQTEGIHEIVLVNFFKKKSGHLDLYTTLAIYKTTHEQFFYLERFFLFLFLFRR